MTKENDIITIESEDGILHEMIVKSVNLQASDRRSNKGNGGARLKQRAFEVACEWATAGN